MKTNADCSFWALLAFGFLRALGCCFGVGESNSEASESLELDCNSSISRSFEGIPDIALSSGIFLGIHLFAGRGGGLSPYVYTAIRRKDAPRDL